MRGPASPPPFSNLMSSITLEPLFREFERCISWVLMRRWPSGTLWVEPWQVGRRHLEEDSDFSTREDFLIKKCGMPWEGGAYPPLEEFKPKSDDFCPGTDFSISKI